ncbi:MAG TPA: TonB family protein [Candidatus Cybelea sp.]|nr:TonB family protein [Candidatus Cybelea sp.]
MAAQAQSIFEGQTIDGKFPLRQHLGGSPRTTVFLTLYGEVRPRDAAIKLLPAPPGCAEAQLSRWRFAANLSHPNLLRIFDFGRCELGNVPMLYVVSELASENLAEIIPDRALSPEEAREMLAGVLDVLAFLHSRGFVHRHLKPSNIMAVGETLKVSSDGLYRLNDSMDDTGGPTPYDPPEGTRNGAAPADDIWSLGMTLVEVMTQERPTWNPSERRDPSVPDEIIPPPFAEFARHCLRREPKNRWSATDIRAHLPRTMPTAERTTAPSSAPLPIPAAEPTMPPRAVPDHRSIPGAQLKRYVTSTFAALALLAAIWVTAKTTGHHTAGPVLQPASRPVEAEVKSPPSRPARPERTPRTAPLAALPVRQPAPDKAKVEVPVVPVPPAPVSTAASEQMPAHVIHQVLPDVPKKASDTIWGTVRVIVRATVDPSGSVTGAELTSAGPSRYFARLSVDAARKWEFDPARKNGQAVPSVWLLRFNYTRTGTTVLPTGL